MDISDEERTKLLNLGTTLHAQISRPPEWSALLSVLGRIADSLTRIADTLHTR